jgi:hypothetical protein
VKRFSSLFEAMTVPFCQRGKKDQKALRVEQRFAFAAAMANLPGAPVLRRALPPFVSIASNVLGTREVY